MQKFQNIIKGIPLQAYIFVIGWLAFIPLIDKLPLFDGIEKEIASIVQNILQSGNYRELAYSDSTFRIAPPLYYWVQLLSAKIFSDPVFASRFPNALIGLITMLFFFHAGKKYFDESFGVFWAIALVCMPGSLIFFKANTPFPLFFLLIFSSLYWLFTVSIKDEFAPYKISKKNKTIYLFLSGIAAGLTVLTYGVFSVIIICSIVGFILFDNKGKLAFSFFDLIKWLLLVLLIVGAWLSYQYNVVGLHNVKLFVQSQLFALQKTNSIVYYFQKLLILLYSSMPMIVFCIYAIKKNPQDTFHQQSFRKWMLVLFVFVLLFGAISHEVAAHLLTITYIPISFCGAYTIHRIYHHKNKRTSAFAIVIFYLIIFVTIGFIFNKSILGLLDIKQANIIVTLFSSNKLFLSLLLSYNLAIIASLLFYSRDKIVTAICILLIASSLFYYASTTLALCEIFVLQ